MRIPAIIPVLALLFVVLLLWYLFYMTFIDPLINRGLRWLFYKLFKVKIEPRDDE